MNLYRRCFENLKALKKSKRTPSYLVPGEVVELGLFADFGGGLAAVEDESPLRCVAFEEAQEAFSRAFGHAGLYLYWQGLTVLNYKIHLRPGFAAPIVHLQALFEELHGDGVFYQSTLIRPFGKGPEISGKIVPQAEIPKVHLGIFYDLKSAVGVEGFQELDDIGLFQDS